MFLDNFEDIFEGLGFFKYPLTTYNDEILNNLMCASIVKWTKKCSSINNTKLLFRLDFFHGNPLLVY